MDNEEIYFNFPVHLLQNACQDIRETMNNIIDYAGYVHTLNLKNGNDEKKMLAAGKYFKIRYGSPKGSFEKGRMLFNSKPQNLPMTGININILFEFYRNPKTEYEIIVLLAFLAFKSIIGNKQYACISNNFMLSRMAGFSNMVEKEQLPEPMCYYKRWTIDKIKAELCDKWNLSIYGYRMNGFYCSLKLSTDELAEVAEEKRLRCKLRNHNGQQKKAREKAIENLYKKLTSKPTT